MRKFVRCSVKFFLKFIKIKKIKDFFWSSQLNHKSRLTSSFFTDMMNFSHIFFTIFKISFLLQKFFNNLSLNHRNLSLSTLMLCNNQNLYVSLDALDVHKTSSLNIFFLFLFNLQYFIIIFVAHRKKIENTSVSLEKMLSNERRCEFCVGTR